MMCLTFLWNPVYAQTAEHYLKVADSMLDAKDLEGAAAALREAHGLDEHNLDILRKLADISIRLGDFAAARQALVLVLEKDHTDVNSYLELARLEWLFSRFDMAMQFVDLAEQAATKPVDKIPAYRAIIFLNQGMLAEAESVLVAARKEFPKSPIVLSNLGLVSALTKDPETGFEYVEQAYELDSTDVYTLGALANLYLAAGEFDKAKALYLKMLEIDPLNYFTRKSLENFDRTAKEMRIQILMAQGVEYFDRSLYLQARKTFREVIELDSTFFEAYLNLGFTLNLLGEPRNAMKTFEMAEELNDSSAPLNIGWGNALAEIREYDSALVKYETAMKLDSTIAELHDAIRTVKQLKARSQGEKR